MQVAGGLDFLVRIATRILQNNPRRITLLAPAVTYGLTLLAGTGAVAFSVLPVVAEVAKRAGIRPVRPLSIAVIASLVAITASPISAAVVIFSGILFGVGVDYVQLLAIAIPSTFLAVMAGAVVAGFQGQDLKEDPVYRDRLALGVVRLDSPLNVPRQINHRAKRALLIFCISIACVVFYALAASSQVALISEPALSLQHAIITFMLAAAALITLLCRVDPPDILNASTFKSGMSACFCVLGVAWLGITYISSQMTEITLLADSLFQSRPWTLAVILFFAAILLYSQAATTAALMPAAIALGISPLWAIAAFPAVNALFVLPIYPTLLAAIEFDDTGSTRLGKFLFDHPFFLPGTCTITLGVMLSFLFRSLIL